jgi:hypothetical protein
MEVLVEQEVIPPMGIALEFFRAAEHGTASGAAARVGAPGPPGADQLGVRFEQTMMFCSELQDLIMPGFFAASALKYTPVRRYQRGDDAVRAVCVNARRSISSEESR